MTPHYAAPEFFDGRTTDSSDQYSLAVTYCKLRGGKLPFDGSPHEVMKGHLYQDPDLSMLPEDERTVVGRALAKDPRSRWPTCHDFVTELSTCHAFGNIQSQRSFNKIDFNNKSVITKHVHFIIIFIIFTLLSVSVAVMLLRSKTVIVVRPPSPKRVNPQFDLDQRAFHKAREAASAASWDAALAILEPVDIGKVEDKEVIEYVDFSKRCANTAKALGIPRPSNTDSWIEIIQNVDWGKVIVTLIVEGKLDLLNEAREIQKQIPRYLELDSTLVKKYGVAPQGTVEAPGPAP
jgi:serine/threonine protein kinase